MASLHVESFSVCGSCLAVADLSGSATLIDCEKTKGLDGKDLALLKKRLKDPAVIKFAQMASLHVESFSVCGSCLAVADLSGSATLIDCEKTKGLDGKDLALLKKRLKDPAVIKFAQMASLHVESFSVCGSCLAVADLSGSATLIDCEKTKGLDGKDLALLKKRLKDPAVIKFAQMASLHVESFSVCGSCLAVADLSGSATLIDCEKTKGLDGKDLALLKKRLKDPAVIKFAQMASLHVESFSVCGSCLAVADLSGSATLIDCEKTKGLDGKDLALLKKRLKDPAVIKFAQMASLHVESFSVCGSCLAVADLSGSATLIDCEKTKGLDGKDLALLKKRLKDPAVIKFAQMASLHVESLSVCGSCLAVADLSGSATLIDCEKTKGLDGKDLALLKKRLKDPAVIKFAQMASLHVESFSVCGSCLAVADLSGSATLIDCEKTKGLDGKDLALLKKRLKDPAVIKFAQMASLHVESFSEHFGFECPGWFNLEWLGLRGTDKGRRLVDMVSGMWGEEFEALGTKLLVEHKEANPKLDAGGRYAACQRAQLALDLAAYQLLLVKRTVDPVIWGWALTTPRPERIQDIANGRIRLSNSICQVEKPCSLSGSTEMSIWQSDAWYGRQEEVADTMKRLEEKFAATKKVMLSHEAFGSGQLTRALYAYAQEMLALEMVAAVESGFFPSRTKDKYEVEQQRGGSRVVRYSLTMDPTAWGGEIMQPSKAEASCILDASERKEGLDRGKEQSKREAILGWCRKFTERLEPVMRDLRIASASSIRQKLRPPSKKEQRESDKNKRYQKDLLALWNLERAFWFELRNLEGLTEPRKKRTALTPADNRVVSALYSSMDLLPNEVAERSWRLVEAPKTVRVKAKSAYTAEKLIAAAKEELKAGRSKVEAAYLTDIPPQFEEEHKRELLGSDSESEDEGEKEKETVGPRSPSPVEEAAPMTWAVERDYWIEVYDLSGLGATGNFDLTDLDSEILSLALAPLLPPSANPELDLVSMVRLRHDSNAILSARLRTAQMVQDTLTRAKDKTINTKGLRVRLATRQPRQVRLAVREAEAKRIAALMRLNENSVLVVNDILERVVCSITGEPEPPLMADAEEETEDDEVLEVVEDKATVEVISLDLDSDEEQETTNPTSQPPPNDTGSEKDIPEEDPSAQEPPAKLQKQDAPVDVE